MTNFVYPPLCLHCADLLPAHCKQFCEHCVASLTLIDPAQRCPHCFIQMENETSQNTRCKDCIKIPRPWNNVAAALDYEGPAVSLVTAMKYGGQSYLSEGAAGFLAAQLVTLGWPLPDILVPVPISFPRWMLRGYNQSTHLARHLGKILDRPVHEILKRKSGGYSQAGLSSAERKALPPELFQLTEGHHLEDTSVLIIDDVMTTGTTLERCAEVLLEGFPKEIRALILCRAL